MYLRFFTTVPDSTASNSVMTDNMEFGKERSNLKTISSWHLPRQNKTPADRSEKSRCSAQIRTGNLKASLKYYHLNYPAW
jgi:hypothetical protein